MQALVGTKYGNKGVFAVIHGSRSFLEAANEEELRAAMAARLKTSGQYPAETRSRWREVERDLHPARWKPEEE